MKFPKLKSTMIALAGLGALAVPSAAFADDWGQRSYGERWDHSDRHDSYGRRSYSSRYTPRYYVAPRIVFRTAPVYVTPSYGYRSYVSPYYGSYRSYSSPYYGYRSYSSPYYCR